MARSRSARTRACSGCRKKVGIDTAPPRGDAGRGGATRAELRDGRPARPRTYALRELHDARRRTAASSTPTTCPSSGRPCRPSTRSSRATSSSRGWVVEKPSKVVARWAVKGALAHRSAGVVAIVDRRQRPDLGARPRRRRGRSSAASSIIGRSPRACPAVTMAGAMIRAMLAAYRRTLQKTMEQARSMQQVVDRGRADWLETPDQAVVWGTALGLQAEIEDGPAALPRGRRVTTPSLGLVDVLPGLVPGPRSGSSVGERSRPAAVASIFSGSAVPGRRRHDVGPRDDRELPVIVGRQRRRVQRRFVGRWWRGRRAAASSAPPSDAEHRADRRRDRRSRLAAAAVTARSRRTSGTAACRGRRPVARASRVRSPRSRGDRETAFEAVLSRKAEDSANRAPSPSNANASTAARISFPRPWPWCARPSQEPVSTVRVDREPVGGDRLRADRRARPPRRAG